METFFSDCPDAAVELSLLSHEYGHFTLKHDGIIQRGTAELCEKEFQMESDAWDEGERVLKSIEFEAWDIFQKYRKLGLDGYYDGFIDLFSNFGSLVSYKR